MTIISTIPLVANTNQSLTISLAGTTYNVNVWWNVTANCWFIDFYDTNNNPILTGTPLVGAVDLLAQYGYLSFGGQLVTNTNNQAGAAPTFSNLGVQGQVFFATPT